MKDDTVEYIDLHESIKPPGRLIVRQYHLDDLGQRLLVNEVEYARVESPLVEKVEK